MSKMKYQDINIKTIERWITEEDWEWGRPITHDVYEKALNGEFDVLLTPKKAVPHEWLADIKGKKLLGLASGGAQQMPIFVALGAECTIIDLSDKQLESERIVSEREKYEINIVKGDITERLPFNDNEFDIIFSPVSYCYIEKLEPLFKECYRILKPNGIYMFGADNGINFITEDEKTITNSFPFNPLINDEQMKLSLDSDSGIEFSHTLEEYIKGVLNAGFRIIDIYEDINNEGRLSDLNIPTYFAILLKK